MTVAVARHTTSWSGLQAWVASSAIHAFVLMLLIPLWRQGPLPTSEPFLLTINLVGSFDSERPRETGTPEQSAFEPTLPSETVAEAVPASPQGWSAGPLSSPLPASRERSVPAIDRGELPATALLHAHSRETDAPASMTSASHSLMPTEINPPGPPSDLSETFADRHEVPQPTPPELSTAFHSPEVSNDQTSLAIAAQAAATELATAPPATSDKSNDSPTASEDTPSGHSVALQSASREPWSEQALQPSKERAKESVPHKGDYAWLQQAVLLRLEELKRSSRPALDDAGRIRVLVKAVVSNDGELVEASVMTSSGLARIDQEAMRLVQRAFPLRFDRTLDRPQVVMRIPIIYQRGY